MIGEPASEVRSLVPGPPRKANGVELRPKGQRRRGVSPSAGGMRNIAPMTDQLDRLTAALPDRRAADHRGRVRTNADDVHE